MVSPKVIIMLQKIRLSAEFRQLAMVGGENIGGIFCGILIENGNEKR
ncbi:hypothetical protein EV207_12236 [Scopulibacillus darangshiensis]|uniref:Uncharacterized protein n=1 Tax=Scopulibacillus darangshiensis TaxID=442528 RepID=A0A4R2NSL3_9BACL|nr:hypothetical protein EV207_12236 [Scopulibacillus darangshiensis]